MNEAMKEKIRHRSDHYVINESSGYWRSYGYGLLCVYNKDFLESGGFDMSIKGWGLEDVDLVNKFLEGGGKSTGQKSDNNPLMQSISSTKIDVMRTPEPSLIHVYHASHCDPQLQENQLRMCLASRASGLVCTKGLSQVWYELKQNTSLLKVGTDEEDADDSLLIEMPAGRRQLLVSDDVEELDEDG